MVVGCIEDVTFTAGGDTFFTPNQISRKYSASYGSHARAAGDTLVDFASEESETYSLSISLSEYAGVNVAHQLNLLREYLRNGTACRMVFGNKPCGKYRWVIQSMNVKEKMWSKDGTVTLADVTLTMLEYLRK